MPFVSSQIALMDVLNAAIANVLTSSGSTHAEVHLAQAPFNPTATSDPTTFTEATFTGYAMKSVAAWEVAYLSGQSAKTNGTAVLSWTPTDSLMPNSIGGYWIIGGNGDYLGGEAFPVPLNIIGPSTPVNLVPAYGVAPPNFSATVIM
jgi:hypothetical protein